MPPGHGSERLLQDALRIPLERHVSAFLGMAWRVLDVRDRSDVASHPAALLSDGAFSIFVKLGVGEFAREQFTRELSGLRALTERSGVLTPTGIGIVQVGDEALLVLEAVEVVERTPEHWRQMGRALARLHGVKGERFGFETHAYWGSLFEGKGRSRGGGKGRQRVPPGLRAGPEERRSSPLQAHAGPSGPPGANLALDVGSPRWLIAPSASLATKKNPSSSK